MRIRRTPLGVLTVFIVVGFMAGCTRQQAQQPGQPAQPAPAEKLKIGIVYDVGGRGDLSFNDMAFAGLERAQQEFGDRIETRDLEAGTEQAMRQRLAEQAQADQSDAC